MDWAKAIERNSKALRDILAVLYALFEAAGGAVAERLPRSLHSAVLGVLRPAESAVRRLIVIAARGLAMKPAPARPGPAQPIPRGAGNRLVFPLFDPRKRIARRRVKPGMAPRIHGFTSDPLVAALWPAPPPAVPSPPEEGSSIDAHRLRLRLEALKLALDDLPRQARRLARWRARREMFPALQFRPPLRPGPPPGHRSDWAHPVDRILADCHRLARDALVPDTS